MPRRLRFALGPVNAEAVVSPQFEKVDNSFADTQLPKSSAPLPLPIVSTAKELFAGATGLSGPQLFDFFANYSDDISRMRYGSDVPSRKEMFENFLENLAVDKQREAVLALCDGYSMKTPPDASAVQSLREKIRGVPVPASLGKAVETIDDTFRRSASSVQSDSSRTRPCGEKRRRGFYP
jgi:hypothetical protein